MRRSWSRSNNLDIEEVINMRNQYISTFEQDHPCRAQIIRCKADRDAAPMNDYRYPEESGSFTGTLSFRCWHRSKPR